MSSHLPLESVATAASRFVAEVLAHQPSRIEAQVASADGMPLLCAVEAAFGAGLARATAQELVWLSGAPQPGVHLLKLQAFAADNRLLGEAVHHFPAGPGGKDGRPAPAS